MVNRIRYWWHREVLACPCVERTGPVAFRVCLKHHRVFTAVAQGEAALLELERAMAELSRVTNEWLR